MAGNFGRDRNPTALITALAVSVPALPSASLTSMRHVAVSSSHVNAVTSVENRMCSRTPNVSTHHCR